MSFTANGSANENRFAGFRIAALSRFEQGKDRANRSSAGETGNARRVGSGERLHGDFQVGHAKSG